MTHNRIDDYGIIGDLHTAVLVSNDGSLDWACLPDFDSPSVFAALLDEEKGGHFRIGASNGGTTRQLYYPETNVLITRFAGAGGIAQVLDFMPVNDERHERSVIRYVQGVRGSTPMRLECRPRFNYARTEHTLQANEGTVVFAATTGERLGRTSTWCVHRPFGDTITKS